MFKLNKELLKKWFFLISTTLILLLLYNLAYYVYAQVGNCSDDENLQVFSGANINFLQDNFSILQKEKISEIVFFSCSSPLDINFKATIKVPPEHGKNILKHAEHLYQAMNESDKQLDFYKEHGPYISLEERMLSFEVRNLQNSLYRDIRNHGDKISIFNTDNELEKIIVQYRSLNINKSTVAKTEIYWKKLKEYAQIVSSKQNIDQIKFRLPHMNYQGQTMEFLINLDKPQEDWVITLGLYSF